MVVDGDSGGGNATWTRGGFLQEFGHSTYTRPALDGWMVALDGWTSDEHNMRRMSDELNDD